MKATGVIRRIDELGRLVVPKEIRKNLGIFTDDPIEIYVDGEQIILKKHQEICVFCGSGGKLLEYKDKKICENCISEIKEK